MTAPRIRRRMHRAPGARLALLVLAMMMLRALVPAGFMLGFIDGHLAYVLCDADAGARAPHAGHQHPAAAHESSDFGAHHPGGPHGTHSHHPDPSCPFAQSAGPALPMPLLAAVPPVPPRLDIVFRPTRSISLSGPARQQSPRGPPRLS